jgi:hypothetical protein
MNKEQFKKSILDLINYYNSNLVQLNMSVAGLKADENKEIIGMAEMQARALTQTFQMNLNKKLDELLDLMPEEGEVDE